MGAHPYWYVVDYEPDLRTALEKLREREFKAGRYNPVIRYLEFPITANSPAPGAKHASIAAAQTAAREDGTRSILDVSDIADERDFGVAAPLSDDELIDYYGTTRPTREMVEPELEFFENMDDRGQAIYIILYDDDAPKHILFAGYSFD